MQPNRQPNDEPPIPIAGAVILLIVAMTFLTLHLIANWQEMHWREQSADTFRGEFSE